MIELVKVFRNYGCEYGVALVDYHGGMESNDYRVWILEGVDWHQADSSVEPMESSTKANYLTTLKIT